MIPDVYLSIFFSGIHAREWIAPATAFYVIEQLAKDFSAGMDNDLTRVNWYFMPLLNPDGYEHSHEADRMWRKNMRAAPDGISAIKRSLPFFMLQCKSVDRRILRL